MKRSGILHADLAGHLARLGHTDHFLVVDSGFPVSAGIPVVDLRVVYGLPGFTPVLTAVLEEVVIEHAVAAEELRAANPAIADVVAGSCGQVETVPHASLKERAVVARFAVRTGEDTPYANLLLRAGVGFPV